MGVSVVFLSCRKQLSAHHRDGGSAFVFRQYFTREKKKTSTTEAKKVSTIPLFHGGVFGRP